MTRADEHDRYIEFLIDAGERLRSALHGRLEGAGAAADALATTP